jgi:hypothetical protein
MVLSHHNDWMINFRNMWYLDVWVMHCNGLLRDYVLRVGNDDWLCGFSSMVDYNWFMRNWMVQVLYDNGLRSLSSMVDYNWFMSDGMVTTFFLFCIARA